MFLFFHLFGSVTAASLTPTTSLCFSQNITLSSSKQTFNIPLTQLLPSQNCVYQFTVPSDSFAVVNVLAFNMHPRGTGTGNIDYIGIYDSSKNVGDVAPGPDDISINSTLAWPTDFGIRVTTKTGSQMLYQISVQLQKSQFGQRMGDTYYTDLGTPSILLYPDDVEVGVTYTFVSQKKHVSVISAAAFRPFSSVLNNIFLYDNGKLVRLATTLRPTDNTITTTISNTMQIYVARSLDGLDNAAFLFTDYSNLAPLSIYYVSWIPLGAAASQERYDTGVGYYGNRPGCVSIFGPKTPVPMYLIVEAKEATANTYMWIQPWGPEDSGRTKTVLNDTTLPLGVKGNLNTVCMSAETGEFGYYMIKTN